MAKSLILFSFRALLALKRFAQHLVVEIAVPLGATASLKAAD